jgi:pSer/pThr/pTyr-binding forkhead associated (FHA) protein
MLTHMILTDTTDELKTTDFVFEGQEQVVIGRFSGCGLRLNDPTVSRRHCLIAAGETVWVRDLGSLNGTYLNGENIGQRDWREGDAAILQTPRMALRDGDELRLGGHVFRVTLESVDAPEGEEAILPFEPELCAACA